MNVILEWNGYFSEEGDKLLHHKLDLPYLQNTLIYELEQRNIEVDIVEKVEAYDPEILYLSYHKISPLPNVWTLKRAYIPGYYYLDKCGYSGWAEICQTELQLPYSQIEIDIFYKKIKEYLSTRVSKYKQSNEKFKCDSPYVFIPLQMDNDTVAKLGYMSSLELAAMCVEAYKGTNYKVVIKQHPCNDKKIISDKTIVTNASIHDIIPSAKAIYTVNSGVGFESLLYLKNVMVAGKCDYSQVCNTVKSFKDIGHKMYKIQDENRIKKYLYHMLNFYYLNINDQDNIKHHINRIIKQCKEL